jgi:hypothetical protein
MDLNYEQLAGDIVFSRSLSLVANFDTSKIGNGKLILKKRGGTGEWLCVEFKNYVEIYSRVGYICDMYSVDPICSQAALSERIEKMLIDILLGRPIYVFDYDTDGRQKWGDLVAESNLDESNAKFPFRLYF